MVQLCFVTKYNFTSKTGTKKENADSVQCLCVCFSRCLGTGPLGPWSSPCSSSLWHSRYQHTEWTRSICSQWVKEERLQPTGIANKGFLSRVSSAVGSRHTLLDLDQSFCHLGITDFLCGLLSAVGRNHLVSWREKTAIIVIANINRCNIWYPFVQPE